MMDKCYRAINTPKADHTHKILGYSAAQLLGHLKKFPKWDELKNKSWHLDHIFPIAAFVRNGITDISVICCLENLQPLDGLDNNYKNDSYNQSEFEAWLNKRGIKLKAEACQTQKECS